MTTHSPVLFLVFNRPETTRRVFDAIRQSRPPRLYVAADGARRSRIGETERCDEVRRIATAVDWPCQVHLLLRDENLGCKRAVSSAISWFFSQEAEGIILEDDCLPDPSFFPYCDELLERYRHDERVMCISGDNFISAHWQPEHSYYFSRYVHIWGWASWRRAWQHYDVDMRAWRQANKRALLTQWLPESPQARAHWHEVFDRVAAGRIDTWDYQWTFACWQRGGLTCMPRSNLISNIGFGAEATHTISPDSKHANLGVASIGAPLRHPATVKAHVDADDWTSEHVFEVGTKPIGLLQRTRHLASALAHRWRAGRMSRYGR